MTKGEKYIWQPRRGGREYAVVIIRDDGGNYVIARKDPNDGVERLIWKKQIYPLATIAVGE